VAISQQWTLVRSHTARHDASVRIPPGERAAEPGHAHSGGSQRATSEGGHHTARCGVVVDSGGPALRPCTDGGASWTDTKGAGGHVRDTPLPERHTQGCVAFAGHLHTDAQGASARHYRFWFRDQSFLAFGGRSRRETLGPGHEQSVSEQDLVLAQHRWRMVGQPPNPGGSLSVSLRKRQAGRPCNCVQTAAPGRVTLRMGTLPGEPKCVDAAHKQIWRIDCMRARWAQSTSHGESYFAQQYRADSSARSRTISRIPSLPL
jgi:hypothetical protein